ncbi:MAG: YgjV family protein [Clostridia bacterium]|nr:YgjV family protein [Clostridia bacterium]
MENEVLALIVSFLAMTMVVISYFVKIKKYYLLFQSLCIVFLILSYLFTAEFFAMIGLSIGLVRSLVFYYYEKKGIEAPIYLSFLISFATIVSYFIVNLGILKTAKPVDILCIIPLVMYAFIFRIRNLKIVRFTMLVPTAISILYNTLANATVFVVLSYTFELTANVVSICKYHIFNKEEKTQLKENTYEND